MKWAALTLLWVGAAAAAEPSREWPFKCNDGGTQQELEACSRDGYAEADRKLNETYRALLRKERGNAVYLAKLREAQKAWIVFRDAEIAANFACEENDVQYCFGSAYGMALFAFKKKLTDERQARLQRLLEKGRETT